jgi:hypothetical protein
MRNFLFTACLVLASCAAPDKPTDHKNQPHLPPPEFSVGEAPSETDRICSGRIAGELSKCEEAEFCYIPINKACGGADFPGVCRLKPEMVTAQYLPVCGCDGKTYGNEGEAHAAGVSASYFGDCKT